MIKATLHDLSERNKKEDIKRLIKTGADINEQSSYGQTALYFACENNHTEIIKILLENHHINVNLQDYSEDSPFLRACSWNKYESVFLLIQDARVDVNLPGNDWSPLMWACWGGKTRVVQLLLSFGRYVDVNKKTTRDYKDSKSHIYKAGSTALTIARRKSEYDDEEIKINKSIIVKLLEQYQSSPAMTQQTLRNQLHLKGKDKA